MSAVPKWKDVFEAAINRDIRTVENFVEKEKAVLRKTNDKGESVALIAARNYDFPTLKYVLEKDNSLLLQSDDSGHNIIEAAINNSATYTVKYLVEHHNWSVHHQNRAYFGNTPIHYAAEKGNLDILKYLIERSGGDVNIRNDVGDPPLFLAAKIPHMEIIKYLVEERGADLKATNSRNENILFIAAAAKQDNPRVFHYVLYERRVPLNINWVNNSHQTVLYVAIRKHKPSIIGYLVGRTNVDINIGDDRKRSPLHIAAFDNNYPLCKLLVEHGANLRAKDSYGFTPIENAHSQNLAQYFQSLTLEQSSWSVTSSISSTSPLNMTSLGAYELSSKGQTGSSVAKVATGEFTTFLGVASTIASRINFSTLNSFQSLSPSEVVSERLDPMAMEAVNTVL